MKMNTDNPKLTAYALGELDETERSTIARAIADSPEAQRFIADTQQLARALRSQYGRELEEESIAPAKFITVVDDPFWSKNGPLAIAAALALLALVGAIAFGTYKSWRGPTLPGSATREVAAARPERSQFAAVEAEEGEQINQSPRRETEAAPHAIIGEQPFVAALSKPHSSFPIIVGSASYLEVQRSINGGILPGKDTVRIEEMINYFNYDYPEPAQNERFSVNIDVASCPWEQSHRLVRIGLKGRDVPSDVHNGAVIAKDPEIDVEFNPARIGSYRLIGYDRRSLQSANLNQENTAGGGIRAGYRVTALYELVPVAQQSVRMHTQQSRVTWQAREDLLSAKLRFKKPASYEGQLIERTVTDEGVDFAAAHQDLKFAAAVAEFGMILRDSDYKGNGTFGAVLEWAQEGKGTDAKGDRAGFIELVRKAQALKRG
jgi:hypothetical protein